MPERAIAGIVAQAAMLSALVAGCGGGGVADPPVVVEPPSPTPVQPGPPPVSLRFVDATTESGIEYRHAYLAPTGAEPEEFGGGVAAGDYDGDGLIDLFVVRGDIGPNLLYRNLGGNVFEDAATTAGVAYTKSASGNHRHSGPAFADLDGDGDLDLFVGGLEFAPAFVFRNEGAGTFADVTDGSGLDALGAGYTLSAGFGDYDLDGDLDMFLPHWGTERELDGTLDTEHLWRNDTGNGAIRFTDVSLAAGIAPDIINAEPLSSAYGSGHDYTFTATFARMNADRYPDLLIAADFRTSMFYVNNGDGTFYNATNRAVIRDRNGMGSAVGDYDSDRDLDWFVSSIWSVPDADGQQTFELGNRLYRNVGENWRTSRRRRVSTMAAGGGVRVSPISTTMATWTSTTRTAGPCPSNLAISIGTAAGCSSPTGRARSRKCPKRLGSWIPSGASGSFAPTSTTTVTWTSSRRTATRRTPPHCGGTTPAAATCESCSMGWHPTPRRLARGSGSPSRTRCNCARS